MRLYLFTFSSKSHGNFTFAVSAKNLVDAKTLLRASSDYKYMVEVYKDCTVQLRNAAHKVQILRGKGVCSACFPQ